MAIRKLNFDLHWHSGYAGGVGSIQLADFLKYAPLKGIQLVGTGDAQFKPWRAILEESLIEDNDSGLFVQKYSPI
ncbi:MAG TPA: hypothetical protein VJ044_09915, partial [Candidatus Hodarchaeales archaeon]|nr:hypothetical protein [Candidatus Hodarchaeales archaeon]